MIYLETLPKKTAEFVEKLQSKNNHFKFLNNFYLSGGTALSLQIGHRESEDLDFFNKNQFNPELLQRELLPLGKLEETELASGTLNTFVDNVKLQFLEYPYEMIKPTVQWDNIALSSIEDIACTKLQTIGMRGSKKDFIDLYFLLDKFLLPELFELLDRKYLETDYSKTHILKSLVYFEDAQMQPMPRMHMDVSWSQVKDKLKKVSKSFSFY
ncbi:nucleotidyl transferase AbiEii/AbiGii toxin family protein [Patescibacteria group bacterium]|nr:nucleotidyl transferase AbiEii/AbiGii toxin family protein [Patescibacteria group bacterium]